ncbi:MAG: MFS transporter [Anaerolineae bacterium]|nr:MFS transporter [Anaerolineae bacterium]MDW8101726.1 MFS transporter [Anaerolineae bacterium]
MDERKVTLWVAALGAFVAPFMGSSFNIALPSIGKEFSAGAVILGWLATLYLLASAVFLVPFGKLADIYGRKRIFLAGLTVYSIASILCGLTTSLRVFMVLRILQGMGAAAIFGTGVAILTSVFPPDERGRALGINVSSTYLGLSSGPFLGGLMTQYLGWRSVFFLNAFISLLAAGVTLSKLKGEWRGDPKGKFDLTGFFVYAIALSSFIYGFSRLPHEVGWLLTGLGIVTLFFFVWWENREQSPLLSMRLFRGNPAFTFSNLAALINYSATHAVSFILSLYLQYVRGFLPGKAGTFLVAQPIVMAFLSPLAGRASDWVEPRILASSGMAVIVVGLLLLSSLGQNSPIEFLLAVLAFLGVGFAFFSSPNTNAVMSSVDKRFYGVASATLATMRLTGQMLSMGIATMVLNLFLGNAPVNFQTLPAFMKAMKVLFYFFALLCFGGIFASLARGNVREA